MTHKLLLTICFVVTGLVFHTGCSSAKPRPAGFPDTVSCIITITQEGSPLAGARVSLIPTDGAKDWLVSALTDGSGVGKVYTYGQFEGAPKGKYKVIVNKTESDPSQFTPPADESDSAAMAAFSRNVQNEKLNSYALVEAVYSTVGNTPHELEITGKTTQTFDVGKKVKDKLPN